MVAKITTLPSAIPIVAEIWTHICRFDGATRKYITSGYVKLPLVEPDLEVWCRICLISRSWKFLTDNEREDIARFHKAIVEGSHPPQQLVPVDDDLEARITAQVTGIFEIKINQLNQRIYDLNVKVNRLSSENQDLAEKMATLTKKQDTATSALANAFTQQSCSDNDHVDVVLDKVLSGHARVQDLCERLDLKLDRIDARVDRDDVRFSKVDSKFEDLFNQVSISRKNIEQLTLRANQSKVNQDRWESSLEEVDNMKTRMEFAIEQVQVREMNQVLRAISRGAHPVPTLNGMRCPEGKIPFPGDSKHKWVLSLPEDIQKLSEPDLESWLDAYEISQVSRDFDFMTKVSTEDKKAFL
ncbi:uncharacterized protein L201_001737 [Kwoniella dendrophila CBS 6074]|uniref:Uncharacterized protein n=1 Tax=Kwoniella dendrophila CBS 6074 TaxID=1295534 RepID=A0AAX4JPQ5_9TREE